ncbi:MAG TPA: phosphoribosylanthranilate isomerase [Bryobacteraceae bacterium]|nr:phosphoribosylanthranilate isomerase [Bryobacteraceae bacterium]
MMVKICGITNREDALAAVDAGATALGFNFYPKSPRYVTPETAAEIANGLKILKVGVFVDHIAATNMDVLQLHGSESPADVPAGERVWKAFRVTPYWSASEMEPYPDNVEAFLLDGPAPGTGQAFDWQRAAGMRNIILAGGLGPDNVAEAIRQARPWGVDACSKLERAPGLKDHDKMRRFVKAALEQI